MSENPNFVIQPRASLSDWISSEIEVAYRPKVIAFLQKGGIIQTEKDLLIKILNQNEWQGLYDSLVGSSILTEHGSLDAFVSKRFSPEEHQEVVTFAEKNFSCKKDSFISKEYWDQIYLAYEKVKVR